MSAPEPIPSVLACSEVCGVPLEDARSALEALTTDGYITWIGPERRWAATEDGIAALHGGSRSTPSGPAGERRPTPRTK